MTPGGTRGLRRSTIPGLGAVLGLLLVRGAAAQSATSGHTLPTFTEHVAPIIFAQCAPCHRPDGPAPFSLLTYEEVRRRATQVAAVTASRYMPPWKPAPGFGEFIGERRLSDPQIAVIGEWVNAGSPEGDPARLPSLPHWTSGWQLGEPDLVITLPEYTLRPDGLDAFRNFVVPVPGGVTRYVRGLEFRPGSQAIHHANIRLDYTPASRRLDEADAGPGYEGLILHSAEYPDGQFLGWTPGQVAPPAPKGLAWRLAPGADFVVQLHMRPTGKPERIQPAIGLYFTSDPPTSVPAMLRLGRQNIDIPPGQADYRSSDAFTLPVDAQVQAVQPHSHYRARQVHAWAELPDGTTRQLIFIPRWDFGWQDVYRLAAPFWLPAGTRLFSEYVFDNSADNPKNPALPPARVLWGFKSSDEMGDVWIQVLTRTKEDRVRLVADFGRKATAEDVEGYEMQIRVRPDYAALHDDVAVLYLELGKPDQAAAHFEATVRLRPRSSVAHYNLGKALEAAGKFSDAAAKYEEALSLDPRYAPAHVNFGNMILKEGRIAEATSHFREAVRLDPDNPEAHNNLGRMLLALDEPGEALRHITEALRLRPSFVEAHFNLAQALTNQGRPRDGVEQYRETLRLRPDWEPALIGLSWILSTNAESAVRDPDEAVRLAARGVEITGRSDPAALDALGTAYASALRFDIAESTELLALDLARRSGPPELVPEIEARLALYRQRRPYVESPR
jgi:tetratricopeptide (TPR) repeat protein/mono/diheme cytochrome c family protein